MHKTNRLIEIRNWKIIYKSDKKEFQHYFKPTYNLNLKNYEQKD
jgi:hypothetical protein